MRFRKPLVAIGIITGSALASTLAFAAWTASGSGSGSAKAIEAVALSASGVDGVGQLYPGSDGDLRLEITNPNPYPVRITEVNGNGTITSDKGTSCNGATGVTFTNQIGQELDIDAGDKASFVLANALHMSNASHTTCQGAIFTVPVSLVGASNAAN